MVAPAAASSRPVVVTGGAGFIGSHLVERLLADGHAVVVVDDLSTGSLANLAAVTGHPRLTVRTSRVSDCPDLADLIAGAQRVYHLAAAVGVELVVNDPIRTIHTNLRETEAVLAAAVPARTPVLFASTSEVYGKSDKPLFAEDDDLLIGPPNYSRWSYACSKLMDEFLALAYHRDHGLPVTIVRFFNIVGPRQSGQHGMVLPRFVAAAQAGLPLRVYGDGLQTRCFCHVRDAVEALTRLAAYPAAVGEVINVGSDVEVTVRGLAERVRQEVGGSSAIETVPYAAVMGKNFQDMPRRRPSLAKLERLTGFRPAGDLAAIIRDAARPMP
jgi:UDP-glucose 4-epimerase